MTDLNQELMEMIQSLAEIKSLQKTLTNQESLLREGLMGVMTSLGTVSEITDFGTLRIQQRIEKDYGEEINKAEADLKDRKKLADDLGDYEIVSTKESLVFTPAKDPF